MDKNFVFAKFKENAGFNLFKLIVAEIEKDKFESLLSSSDKEEIYKIQIQINAIREIETIVNSKIEEEKSKRESPDMDI